MLFGRRMKGIGRKRYPSKNNMYTYDDSLLVKGNTGKKVEELQKKLIELTSVFPILPVVIIDGYYGEVTKKTVELFQEINSLPVTGQVDELTWKKINYFLDKREVKKDDDIDLSDNVIKLGSKGRYVSDLQKYLNIASSKYSDLPSVKVDGYFGEKTLDAVTKFQRKFGLDVDGVVGSVTWDTLYKVSNDEPIIHLD